MQIVHVPTIEFGSPASCNRKKQIIYLNDSIWNQIPESLQKIIILHEQGHIIKNTSSEILADEYAYEHFAGSEPKSLKNLINVFDNYLDLMDENDQVRFFAMATKVLNHDALLYGNENAKSLLNEFKKLKIMNQVEIQQSIANFLQSKGIANINQLTPTEKGALMIEYTRTNEVQSKIANDVKNAIPELQHLPDVDTHEVEHFSMGRFFNNTQNIVKDKIQMQTPNSALMAALHNYIVDIVKEQKGNEHFSFRGAFNKIGSGLKKVVSVSSKIATGIVNVAAGPASAILGGFGIPVDADTIRGVVNGLNPMNIANNLLNKANADDSQEAPPEEQQAPVQTPVQTPVYRAPVYQSQPQRIQTTGGKTAESTGTGTNNTNNNTNNGNPPKDNKMLYIGLGIGAVVLVVIVMLFMKSSSKSGKV